MESVEERPNKRRRLVTACPACRKVKARCEPRSDADKCHRCYALDIECELPTRSLAIDPGETTIESRLRHVEQTLANLLATLPLRSSAIVAGNEGQAQTITQESYEPSTISSEYPQPIKIIDDLQSEFFGIKTSSFEEHSKPLDLVSMGLLTSQTVDLLLPIFIQHYGRWISVSSVADITGDSSQRDGLLTSVSCLLAARFVSSIQERSMHSLYMHVRRSMAEAIVDAPPLKLNTIRALALLSLWSPTVFTANPLDGWFLSNAAASHALVSFKIERQTTPQTERDAQHLRLWSTLCLAHLQYSIGNGRTLNIPGPLIEKCPDLLRSQFSLPSDPALIAEVSLYLILYRLLKGEHKGHTDDNPEIVAWLSNWQYLLDETGPPSALQLSWWFARLIRIRHANESDESNDQERKTSALRQGAIIVSQFVRPDPVLPRDFPDFVFFIAAYAALVLCESAVDYHLVEILQQYLTKVAPHDMHIAHRHGQILKRALQRHQASGNGTNDPMISSLEDAINGDMLYPDIHDFSLDGFDVFGELFSVDSLL